MIVHGKFEAETDLTLKHLPQTEDPPTAGPAADRVAFVRKLGGTVWTEMGRYGIVPTPRAYEAWFAYRTGMNPGLSQRVGELLGAGKALTPAVLDTFHDEFVAGIEVDADAINGKADELQHAAQTLADQVAGNQAAVTGYGNMLTHWAEHLNGETTIGGLVGAVRTLTAETIRAAERNRALEQQLSTSIGRIARLRQSLADVKQEATTDALTGIANRKAFDAKLRRAVAQARSEPSVSTSVLLLDVDHFKRFNDTYGHRTGDLVLRLVGRLLADNVKGRDTVARYGGEEFAILLVGADLNAASVVGQQICRSLSSKRLVNRPSHQAVGHITISIGVAQHRPGESSAVLVERADAALYRAKASGRNRVCTENDPAGDVGPEPLEQPSL